jgi:hypothetical protein
MIPTTVSSIATPVNVHGSVAATPVDVTRHQLGQKDRGMPQGIQRGEVGSAASSHDLASDLPSQSR